MPDAKQAKLAKLIDKALAVAKSKDLSKATKHLDRAKKDVVVARKLNDKSELAD